VKGKTTIKRSLFGVGQGDWSKTDAVKDDVLVEFVLAAKR
jgi:polyisoprenoid-binding protein YceI